MEQVSGFRSCIGKTEKLCFVVSKGNSINDPAYAAKLDWHRKQVADCENGENVIGAATLRY